MDVPLIKATAWAHQIIDVISPFCQEVHIAGSIRRKRPIVHDIDLVVLPHNKAALKARCSHNATVLSDGDKNYLIRLNNGLEIDIFFAHSGTADFFNPDPPNIGSILLCRTGSKEFNQRIARHAHTLGAQWQPYRGLVVANKVIASRTEEEMFNRLNINFMPPEHRNDGIIEDYLK